MNKKKRRYEREGTKGGRGEREKERNIYESESERETETEKETEMETEPARKRKKRGTQRKNTPTQAETQSQRHGERQGERDVKRQSSGDCGLPRALHLQPMQHSVNSIFPRVTGTGLCSLQPREGCDQLTTVLQPKCPAQRL